MTRKCGRPPKDASNIDSRQKIIDTTIGLIQSKGADFITVRNVCQAADLSIGTFYHYFRDKDDLMMYFISETSFEDCKLKTDLHNIADRICELYMILIDRYLQLGESFMKSFYSSDNKSLSAYMGEREGSFPEGTVMARSEQEMLAAQDMGIIKEDVDVHEICADICTIVKGCVFEWCLNDAALDIRTTLRRIVRNYLQSYTV
jgi:AcrR family transcriptional regulator